MDIFGNHIKKWDFRKLNTICNRCKSKENMDQHIIQSHTPDHVWKEYIIDAMQNDGWVKDRDDETILGFSKVDGKYHWIRDYDKKLRRFVQYNGNQLVNLFKENKEIL